MLVDAIDKQGRRYLEVPEFPEGSALRVAFMTTPPDPCVECARPVKHGQDRYFQRNDASDGQGLATRLENALMALTFDVVCGACGDRLIAESST